MEERDVGGGSLESDSALDGLDGFARETDDEVAPVLDAGLAGRQQRDTGAFGIDALRACVRISLLLDSSPQEMRWHHFAINCSISSSTKSTRLLQVHVILRPASGMPRHSAIT